MKKYMGDHHNVTEPSVTLVFRELMKGQKAETYLRISSQRALVRKQMEEERLAREALLQRRASVHAVGISAPSQSDGASSSSSRGRRKK
ncbi:unnamed protein product [Arabis nemorensis]|uniref:Uncharacterized protein n=1 Tax=Arabis nemorensis TaxID=586526 RepID=A0A565CSR2_9BRAS|nr:unnamed protein product [Arabis nemorensis]